MMYRTFDGRHGFYMVGDEIPESPSEPRRSAAGLDDATIPQAVDANSTGKGPRSLSEAPPSTKRIPREILRDEYTRGSQTSRQELSTDRANAPVWGHMLLDEDGNCDPEDAMAFLEVRMEEFWRQISHGVARIVGVPAQKKTKEVAHG